MKALDTNVIVRFLVNDDQAQARLVKELLEAAEKAGQRFLLTTPVLLELIWVLSAVFDFSRDEVIKALDLLTQMPIFEFEDFAGTQKLVVLGRTTRADLPDLLIGLAGRSNGCTRTLTFDKGLSKTSLFEQL